ncbi:hypothetical protein KP509_21G046400 [Ceratopteris richardii]|uniref:Cytochrome b5 n=1 Tax=Ceratopteris richardii TaxID=49495 RepID=A0A8T2S9J6_CERRI|nr:hypothetical protein KP509_21G046400 [Ceratopteris richardii]
MADETKICTLEQVSQHSTSKDCWLIISGKEYYVGDIDPSTIPEKQKYVPPKQASYNPDNSTEFFIKILQFLVPLTILGLALAVRLYTRSE